LRKRKPTAIISNFTFMNTLSVCYTAYFPNVVLYAKSSVKLVLRKVSSIT